MISDNRGHGKSINEDNPMGHFGNEGMKALIADQLTITNYINQTYSLPITIYAHSMGTIIARVYLQEHADLISRTILSGIPCYQSGASMGIIVAKCLALFKGKKGHSKLMTNLVTGQFNKKRLKKSYLFKCLDKL
ncbi:MAG: lysophospholipase [Clostridium sp.]|nr:MAG: lysophospholipase [Clostridium sp.]